MIPIFLLLLATDAKPVDPPKPPRTSPLAEVHQLRLENLFLKFQAAQREMERIKGANDETIAEVCKAASFAKCAIDPEKRVVTEVLDVKK